MVGHVENNTNQAPSSAKASIYSRLGAEVTYQVSLVSVQRCYQVTRSISKCQLRGYSHSVDLPLTRAPRHMFSMLQRLLKQLRSRATRRGIVTNKLIGVSLHVPWAVFSARAAPRSSSIATALQPHLSSQGRSEIPGFRSSLDGVNFDEIGIP